MSWGDEWFPFYDWVDEKAKEAGKDDAKDYQGFGDVDPQDMTGWSDQEKLEWARNLTGDFTMTMDEMHKYFPKFDQEELDYTRELGASKIKDIGMEGRGNLLQMALGGKAQKGRSGFAKTGNPMIDKQRETMYGQMSSAMDTSFKETQRNVSEQLVDYQGDFGERAIDYEDMLDEEKDKDSGSSGGILGTCVLSTAAYRQGLISSDELMSFVKWRITTQKNHFLSEQKWLGYQIAWKPIAELMLKSKTFAKLINNTVLKGWKSWMAGNKAYLTRLILEGSSLIGYILRPNKVKELKQSLKTLGIKGMLKSYKNLIKSIESI